MSFQQGLSGLQAASKNLETIGNNVANANTVGFKGSQAQFADVYANSLSGGGGASKVGIGVKVSQIAQQFTQGNVSGSHNPLDIAINGDGFFRMNNNGVVTFSRNGQFQLDKGGYIVNAAGSRLTGYAADAKGQVLQGQAIDIHINKSTIDPRQTAEVKTALNLDARKPIISGADTPFRANDPSSYSNASPVTVYDSLGGAHLVQTYYVKSGPNTWDMYASNDDVALGAREATPVTHSGTSLPLGAPGSWGPITAGDFSINGISIGAVAAGTDAQSQADNLKDAINLAGIPGVTANTTDLPGRVTLVRGSEATAITISMNGVAANKTAADANEASLQSLTGFSATQLGTQEITATRLGALQFRTDGTLDAVNSDMPLTIPLQFGSNSGVATPLPVQMDFTGSTQFSSNFNVNTLLQDGYSAGELAGFNVGDDGIITGRYTNGKSATLGQVVLSSFANPNGLQPLGNNVWAETADSGQPLTSIPGSGSAGVLQSQAVEDSNVDLTAELVNMITAQRVYQANAQTIKTQDQMMQTLVNLR